MSDTSTRRSHATGPLALGLFLFLGLVALGALLGRAAVEVKEYERTVTAKGLSEREYPADVVIWPIAFTVAGNDLAAVYRQLDEHGARVRGHLERAGIPSAAISLSTPVLTDKSAQAWGGAPQPELRYVATRNVTVYSHQVDAVRAAMGGLVELGKQGALPRVSVLEGRMVRLRGTRAYRGEQIMVELTDDPIEPLDDSVEPLAPPDAMAGEEVELLGEIEVIVDGGIRRGTHVLKAMAMGATACSGGRMYLYALAGAGTAGVDRAMGLMRDEIKRDMQLMGCASMAELRPSMVATRR